MRDIFAYLPKGKANAIPAEKLAALMGLNDTRALRHHISNLRLNGELILSTSGKNGGYFVPATPEEVSEFITENEKSARHTLAILKSAKKYRREFQRGQLYVSSRRRGGEGG